MKVLRIIGVAAVAVFMAACSPCYKVTSLAIPAFAETEWQLVSVNGKPVDYVEDNFFMRFGPDSRISGRGDCNRFFGTYAFTPKKKWSKIKVGQLGTTLMMCYHFQQEEDFVRMAGQMDKIRDGGDHLEVKLKDGTTMILKVRNNN